MRRLQTVIATLLGFQVGFVLCAGCGRHRQVSEQKDLSVKPVYGVGLPAPSLQTLDWVAGPSPRISSYVAGSVYVVQFWATWCPPCVESIPETVSLVNDLKGEGVHFVLIGTESRGVVNRFLDGTTAAGGGLYRELMRDSHVACEVDAKEFWSCVDASEPVGIPKVLIVGRTGLIEWIGHPASMAEPLRGIVEGTWTHDDLGPTPSETNAAQSIRDLEKELRKLTTTETRISTEEILERLDQLAEQPRGLPARKAIARARFEILLKRKAEGVAPALQSIAELEIENAQALNELTWQVYEFLEDRGTIDGALLTAAIQYAEEAVEQSPEDGAILDTLAHLLYLDGQLARALETQRKAMQNPGPYKEVIESFLKELEKEEKAGAGSKSQ